MNTEIRLISSADDQAIHDIIKAVGKEFGAVGDGFGPGDAEVSAMSEHYLRINRSCYYVAVLQGKVVGGCGIAPFNNSSQVCELRKLFLIPGARGLGIGKALTEQCLNDARSMGYQQCYLDTLSNMHKAISLYKRFGFRNLESSLDGSEHGGCDVWMINELSH